MSHPSIMFEIHDEKLGKLQIVNVTEARANFARVLKEIHTKIIITRHGRPSKILISYEEYHSLINHAERPQSTSSLPEKFSPPSPAPQLPGRWSEKDVDQIVKSITHSPKLF